ncbi:hypothetical protein, partial [Rhodopseudomonas sp. BR0C11]|uniref:hypothetical protein n=1 Tax=Rhodopseudomonas sp. BR0C11 TaxID=2269370 RepID=UPI001967117B
GQDDADYNPRRNIVKQVVRSPDERSDIREPRFGGVKESRVSLRSPGRRFPFQSTGSRRPREPSLASADACVIMRE